MNKGVIPEVISRFNVYKGSDDGGEKMLGISNKIDIPALEAITETISGSGILGEIDVTTPGEFGNIEIQIPYIGICEGMFDFSMNKRETITLRASEQSTMTKDGTKVYEKYKFVLAGTVKAYTPGSIEKGKRMESSVTLTVSYMKIMNGDKELLELDKYNEVFKINGEDQLADLRDM